MQREDVFLGRDNTIVLILSADDPDSSVRTPLDADQMAAITKIALVIAGTTYESTNQADDPIRWAQAGYDDGEIRLTLGDLELTLGHVEGRLIVYDADNADGIAWHEPVLLNVIAEGS